MFPSKFLQFPSILTHFHAANEKIQNGGRDLAISRAKLYFGVLDIYFGMYISITALSATYSSRGHLCIKNIQLFVSWLSTIPLRERYWPFDIGNIYNFNVDKAWVNMPFDIISISVFWCRADIAADVGSMSCNSAVDTTSTIRCWRDILQM